MGGSAAFAASQDGCLDNLLVVKNVAALAKTSLTTSWQDFWGTPQRCVLLGLWPSTSPLSFLSFPYPVNNKTIETTSLQQLSAIVRRAMEGHMAQKPRDEPEEAQESLGTGTGRTAYDKPDE